MAGIRIILVAIVCLAAREALAVGPPTGVAAQGQTSQIVLNWSACVGCAKYRVKRATVSGGPYTVLNSNVTQTSFTNVVGNGTTYYYVISGVSSANVEGGNSTQVNAMALAAPTGVTATAGNDSVALSWQTVLNATGYKVKRGVTSGGPYTDVGTPNLPSFTDNNVDTYKTYYYVVTAIRGSNNQSSNSAQVSATPFGTPMKPASVSAFATDHSIWFNWSASGGATSYKVSRSTQSGGPYSALATVSNTVQYLDESIENDTTYYYVVSASNQYGTSPISTQASAKFAPGSFGGSPTPAVAGSVGAIDAQFDVNSSGAATYTIPIKVPPGTSGMQPRLNIAYSSQAGYDGLAGVGFNLAGVSSIERCPPTKAHDDVFGGTVKLESGDRFCLDGMRLIGVSGGTYGTSGAVYHTEAETWTKVVSEGVCSSTAPVEGLPGAHPTTGPCSFTATLKNGTVAKFGESSRAMTSCANVDRNDPNSTRFDWPLTSITDLNGNSMTIAYESGGDNRCVPSRIDYTINNGAGITAQRYVRFIYQARNNAPAHFVAGYRRRLSQRLAEIETHVLGAQYGGDKLVKEYVFGYTAGGFSGRDRLTSIKECEAPGNCLPATTFEWAPDQPSAGPSIYSPQIPSPYAHLYQGDFNGDGLADFFSADFINPYTERSLYLADGNGGFIYEEDGWETDPSIDWSHGEHYYTLDYNGDGYTDLLHVDGDSEYGNVWELHHGSILGLSSVPTHTAEESEMNIGDLIYPGDYDGDGKTELLTMKNPAVGGPVYTGWKLFRWDGSTFYKAAEGSFGDDPEWNDTNLGVNTAQLHPGDFNGDGRVDFFVTKRFSQSGPAGYSKWKVFTFDPTTLTFETSSFFNPAAPADIWPHEFYTITIGDYNGDGYHDVLVTGSRDPADNAPEGYLVMYSTGKTFVRLLTTQFNVVRNIANQSINIPWGKTGDGPTFRDSVQVANLNDDGMDDLLVSYNHEAGLGSAYNGVYFMVSTQVAGNLNGFVAAGMGQRPANQRHIVGDFDRDGLTDYIYLSVSGAVVFQSDKPDWLQHVVDGVGAETWIENEVMYRGAHTKSAGAVYPTRDYVGPRYLTTAATHNNERNLYRYFGARTDVWGRGFLGFERIRAQRVYGDNPALEYFVDTTYSRAYPTAGAVTEQKRCINVSTCINRVYVTTEAVERSPGVHSVRVQKERTQELDIATGAVVFERERTFTYDAYDNVETLNDRADTGSSDPDMRTITSRVFSNEPSMWKLGYLTEETTTNGAGALLGSRRWQRNATTKNIELDAAWDADHGVWLGTAKTYTPYGAPEKLTDPRGNITTLEYDGYQFLERTVNQLGHVIEKTTDARFGNETSRTDENGQEVRSYADGYGRTTRIDGPDGNGNLVTLKKLSLTTAGAGFITQTLVRRHFATSANQEWDWSEDWKDPWGRTVKTRQRGGYENLPIVTEKRYWQRGVVSMTSDPYFEGATPLWTTYTYDGKARPTTASLPDGRQIQVIYNDAAREVHRVDATGTNTYESVNARGNVVLRRDAANQSYHYDYDALGRLTEVNQPGGLWTTNRYDSLGRKTMIDDSVLGTRELEYDATGHLERESDSNGNIIERMYDDLDRTLMKSYYEQGLLRKIVSFDYDDPALDNSIGRLSHVTIDVDAQVESTYELAYDAFGHQSNVAMRIDGYDFHWGRTYDPAGKVVAHLYPDGSEQKVEYTPDNRLGRLRLREFDAAGYQTYARYREYDAAGRPGRLRHKNNVVSCYYYGGLNGRLESTLTIHDPDPTDAAQLVCQDLALTANAVTLLDYDYTWTDDNNIQRINDNVDSLRSQTFSYNGRNELTSASGIYGARIYDYDDNGRLTDKDGVSFAFSSAPGKSTQIEGSSAGLSGVVYDANGNMVEKTLNGATTTLVWDGDDQLTHVSSPNGETSFAYEFTGQRVRKIDANGDTTYYAGADYEVVRSSTGERHTKYVHGPDGVVSQITRTGIVLAATHAQRERALASMYDASTLSGAARSLGHLATSVIVDPASVRAVRLALMTVALIVACVVSARALRRRVGWAKLGTTWVALALVVQFVAPASVAQAALAVGPNGRGVPIVGIFHFTRNQVASTTLYMNEAGAVVTRVEHTPFGEIAQNASSGSDEFRPKFTGKELDDDTQLYYYGARYYDPALGRFISADDRMGGDPERHQSLNRYAYASNNPIIYNDPSGHFAWLALVAVTVVAMGVAFVTWGTEGRIFTDPTNAFDSFSFERAIVGAWVALVSSMVTFGLNTFGADAAVSGAMATKFSVQFGEKVVGALAQGATSVASAYFGGERDGGKLGMKFGLGVLASLLKSLGSLVKGDTYGHFAARMIVKRVGEFAANGIKAAADSTMSFDLMVVNLAYTPGGEVEVAGPSMSFLKFFSMSNEPAPPAEGPSAIEQFAPDLYWQAKSIAATVKKNVNFDWAAVLGQVIVAPASYTEQVKVAPEHDARSSFSRPSADTAGELIGTSRLIEEYGAP